MRYIISLLLFLILLLWANIFAYIVSEDYRFFVKKIKYKQEIVYENNGNIDDSERIIIVEENNNTITDFSPDSIATTSTEGFTFLDVLSGESLEKKEDKALRDLTRDEISFIAEFEKKFVLEKRQSFSSLFDITTEYPDDYHEYANKHISIYVFPTKNYDEIYNIFDVLRYEVPYTLNETNNFWDKSFYINLDEVYRDGIVRIVLESQNTVFWLKIKKDNYNTVKKILEELGSSGNTS